jgi:hypothetical protein
MSSDSRLAKAIMIIVVLVIVLGLVASAVVSPVAV